MQSKLIYQIMQKDHIYPFRLSWPDIILLFERGFIMITDLLGWLIAGLCVLVLITLWFSVSYKELSAKRKNLIAIGEQLRTHRLLCMQERGGENDIAAQKILQNKLMVYHKLKEEYNALLKRPFNRIPGYIMGFHSVESECCK